MIIAKEIEKYDDSARILMYEKDADGNCIAKQNPLEFSSDTTYQLGDEYYYTRHLELERLKQEVLEGKISPIKLLIDYYIMDEKDVAARVQISYRKLKNYLTLKGFKKIDVETLIKFAKLFDLSVADFFQFINVDKTERIGTTHHHDRMIQEISINIKS